MNLNNPAHAHALRYAVETSKVFLMNSYRQKFPHFFEQAVIETRPATRDDYFVPPSLASKCIVVVGTRFPEIACQRLSCFPFKDNWELCKEQDAVRWVRMGQHFELACQPSCREHSMNVEWENGRCVVANPLKKVLASMPEKLFQRASRHVFHGGLDVVRGTLQFNERYCEAYGLDFVHGDCVASGGQSFGEWLFGKTPIRAAKTAHLKPLQSKPPELPHYLNYAAAVNNKSGRRTKRSVAMDEEDSKPFYQELAIELSKDLGRDVSEWAVEKFLRQKAPMLLSQTVDALSVRLVLKHSVLSSIKRLGAMSFDILGKGVAVATNIYALYELGVGILDILDPYDYQKVLSKKILDKVDSELDYMYFKDAPIRPEMTPEYVWDNGILTEDDSERLIFMVERVEEYLNALNGIKANEYSQKPFDKNLFVWQEKKRLNKVLVNSIIIVMVSLVFLFVEWIHVWTMCLFFIMLYVNNMD